MKANEDKCHLHLLKINGVDLISSELNFEHHINSLCKKASSKFHALANIFLYLNVCKIGILMNSFLYEQFVYCPLVWMFCSRTINNKSNFRFNHF